MSRFALVPASYLYLVRERAGRTEILLQLRQNTGYMDGCWAAGAAGHVEAGETAPQAARREAREELGVELRDVHYEFVMHRTAPGGDPVDQRVDFFFTSRAWDGVPTIREPAKCAELAWFALDALPDDVVPYERMAVERLGSDAGYLTDCFDAPG